MLSSAFAIKRSTQRTHATTLGSVQASSCYAPNAQAEAKNRRAQGSAIERRRDNGATIRP